MKKTFTFLVAILSLSCASATIHYKLLSTGITFQDLVHDLDGDGTADFTFDGQSMTTYSVVALKPTSFFAVDSMNRPKSYFANEAMGNYQWQDSTGILYKTTSSSTSNFFGEIKYLMVKFNNSQGQTFYGWYQITHGNYIHDCAWQDVPNKTIKPGEGNPELTGISPISAGENFIANITRNTVSFNQTTEFDYVEVHDMAGRKLAEITNPVSAHDYNWLLSEKLFIVTFYQQNRLLASAKYLIQ